MPDEIDGEVWASDEELRSPRGGGQNSIYDWTERARVAVTRPGKWLLAARDAPPTSASNINTGRVRGLLVPEFAGFVFSARVTGTHSPDPERPSIRRADIWLKADRLGDPDE